MATIEGIFNDALRMVKVSKRVTGEGDTSKAGVLLDEAYPQVRDDLLERHKWNSAMKRVKLNQNAEAPVFGWQFQYKLPGDFIRIGRVYENADMVGKVHYQQEEGFIRTDSTKIFLKYVFRQVDPNLMPPTFRTALSKALAAAVAVALTSSASRRDRLWDEFIDEDLPTAKSVDALQDTAEQLPESEWVSSRWGGDSVHEFTPASPTS